ncbi:uncharacterized protein IL334_001983 [Kwoniella shivajii]|uniref:Uncharacterized protein n=1 Tax=Kwoniella shivajii TaxID=564305 RepID=A0ABZ1CTP3_9TREE|nr:hypothetical protein IL334_001983 [Kwoniella shivajii]
MSKTSTGLTDTKRPTIPGDNFDSEETRSNQSRNRIPGIVRHLINKNEADLSFARLYSQPSTKAGGCSAASGSESTKHTEQWCNPQTTGDIDDRKMQDK